MLRDTLPMCIPPFFRHIYTVSAVCGILWEWRVKWWWNFDDWEKFFNFVAAFANAMLFSMRGILVFVIGFVMLAAAVSCGDAHYDARLAAIDSFIEERPDSALAGLRAMGFDAFSRSDDRAYFALLLTEAQYKCYDSIASTDTIDLAVNHFTGNGDREKLTRSLIFKGATLEELNRKVEAMEFYKQAEENALQTDYKDIGYANLRMAELYRDAYAENELHIEKYKRARFYFSLANDSVYQLKCLNNLGMLYRMSCLDSAYHYIDLAIKLSKKLGDKRSEYRNYACLARAYEMDSLFEDQKKISLYILRHGYNYISPNDTYYDLCKAYSNLNMPDSAQYYFDKSDIQTTNINASRILAQVDLEQSKGNYSGALKLLKAGIRAAHDLEINSVRQKLYYSEKEIDIKNQKIKELKSDQNIIELICFIILLITIVSVISIIAYIRYKNNINNLVDQLSQLRIDSVLQIESHLKNEAKLSSTVEFYINKAKKLTEIYHLYGNHPDKLRTKFIALLENNSDKKQFYEELKCYVNIVYNNAIDKLSKCHPELSEQEVNFMTMLLCNFSNLLISVYMGYKSPHYVYNKKKMLAAKMKLTENLDSYLEKLRSMA